MIQDLPLDNLLL